MKANQFVKHLKKLFSKSTNVKAILGNQSADLDSIVSSISLSYYLFKLNNSNETDVYFPIINSNKSILQSKKECIYLFDTLSIDINDLIYINEFSTSAKFTSVILVDHNELDDLEKSLNLEQVVTGVFDHHLDKGNFLNANPRKIDTSIGSNTTLIAQNFYENKIEIDESFASMMIFPILSDTNNLTCRASKNDIEMFEYLVSITSLDPKKTYDKLEEIKFGNTESEEASVLLKKDYKKYSQINSNNSNFWGMSSVTFCINKWVDDESSNLPSSIKSEIIEFMKEKDIYFLGLLSCFKDSKTGQLTRDMALIGPNDFMKKFENDFKGSSLQQTRLLNYTYKENKYTFLFYDVENVNLTRKYWQPVLENFLKTI